VTLLLIGVPSFCSRVFGLNADAAAGRHDHDVRASANLASHLLCCRIRVVGRLGMRIVHEGACAKISPMESSKVLLTVDADTFEQFVALLDVPSFPNPALERLLAMQVPWASDNVFNAAEGQDRALGP
jgi:hypothetical protein